MIPLNMTKWRLGIVDLMLDSLHTNVYKILCTIRYKPVDIVGGGGGQMVFLLVNRNPKCFVWCDVKHQNIIVYLN